MSSLFLKKNIYILEFDKTEKKISQRPRYWVKKEFLFDKNNLKDLDVIII